MYTYEVRKILLSLMLSPISLYGPISASLQNFRQRINGLYERKVRALAIDSSGRIFAGLILVVYFGVYN